MKTHSCSIYLLYFKGCFRLLFRKFLFSRW